jgi:glycosyltransferase involved in cell wall biosynthesis
MAAFLDVEDLRMAPHSRRLRFDRVAITSVFGDPLNPRTWSGAPFRLASALQKLGVSVEGFQPKIGRVKKLSLAARHLTSGFGRLTTSEQLLRASPARDHHANEIAAFVAEHEIRHILHTGTLDLPAFDLLDGIKHYLYCDHTWSLSLPFRLDADKLTARALDEYERLERDSLQGLEHIFTFGRYVRDEIIERYGVAPERVTAVGSGMGEIEPYFGPKSYAAPRLLFIAKHLFKAKGGELLVEAFRRARQRRPDLTLTVVGDERSRKYLPTDPQITFHGHIPWEQLRDLYRNATLLVQPMLNDPWGQVYLEALISRTPVVGLNRHGLPEIIEGGRYGFLVDRADPADLADTILAALSDSDRLSEMGRSGQRHIINTYSWDRVANRIAFA